MGESLEARLHAVKLEFLRTVPGRIEELVQAWDADLPAAERLVQARHLAHRLAGGAGTLGQAALGAAARILEQELQQWLESERPVDEAAISRWRARSAALAGTLESPAPPP